MQRIDENTRAMPKKRTRGWIVCTALTHAERTTDGIEWIGVGTNDLPPHGGR